MVKRFKTNFKVFYHEAANFLKLYVSGFFRREATIFLVVFFSPGSGDFFKRFLLNLNPLAAVRH